MDSACTSSRAILSPSVAYTRWWRWMARLPSNSAETMVAYQWRRFRSKYVWWVTIVAEVALMLQVLTVARVSGQDGSTSVWTGVDLPPHLYASDVPFFCSGFAPGIFDAPAHNLSGAERLSWTADTFLVAAPLRSRDEAVVPLTWFRWGYDEDAGGRPPHLHPVLPVPRDAWSGHLPLLWRDYPSWTFGDEPSA